MLFGESEEKAVNEGQNDERRMCACGFVLLFCVLRFASILPFLIFCNFIVPKFFIFLSLSVSSTSSLSPCVEHTYVTRNIPKKIPFLWFKKKLNQNHG